MNPRVIFPAIVFVFAVITVAHFSSCVKSCYDADLKAAHENDICPANCPGAMGCDGNSYCNECEANKNGIPVQP